MFFKRLTALALALVLLNGLSACATGEADVTTAPSIATEPTVPTISYVPHNCSEDDPYVGMSKEDFYANYTPACCNQNAQHRSKHGFLSGILEIPGQYAVEAADRPSQGGKYVRNSAQFFPDADTYVVVDSQGREALRIFRAGGYITLEEVAAYMYAFGGKNGSLPANYTSKKSGKPATNIWGEYLRLNHSRFLGNTKKYPYEPELPNISGCGGKLEYYEMDIGTTGTQTPGYAPKPYVQNNSITRGAARLVYARQDLNNNGSFEDNEIFVFYTHNHYNDFREYLNYYGGWGEMFGNITGGGEYSSKDHYNPTDYPATAFAEFFQWNNAA